MKIKKYLLVIFCVACSVQLFGQKVKYTTLDSYDADFESTKDLQLLDSVFEASELIGLGESTHGTHEFSAMRHRIFRYLAEEKGYRLFILEADYGACQRLNRYIHGAPDTLSAALKEVLLWPWQTAEMEKLIAWMRDFNAEHPGDQIVFLGCDMQLLYDDLLEWRKREAVYPSMTLPGQYTLKAVSADTSVISTFSAEIEKLAGSKELGELPEDVKFEYAMMYRTILQCDRMNNQPQAFQRSVIRDSCMADNIVYLKDHYKKKGVYWAHNGHIGKQEQKYARGNCYQAGCYLARSLGTAYFSLALETDEGQFSVMTYDDLLGLVPVDYILQKSGKRSVGSLLRKAPDPVIYLSTKDLKNGDKLKINEIGAVYPANAQGYTYSRYHRDVTVYDGIIFIRNTTPTDVIPFRKLKKP